MGKQSFYEPLRAAKANTSKAYWANISRGNNIMRDFNPGLWNRISNYAAFVL